MILPVLLSLLSGALYVVSFAPWDHAWLQWVCFVPLFLAVDRIPEPRRNSRTTFAIGMIPSLLICIGGFYWMVYAARQYGGLPVGAALAVFALFCLTGQLQIPIYLLLRNQVRNHSLFPAFPFLSLLGLGVLYVGLESIYPKLFLDTAGHAFYHSPWIRQTADLGGVYLLTSLVILVNELITRAVRIRSVRPLLQALGIGVLISGYGIARISQYESLEKSLAEKPKLTIAMIQANIGDFIKLAAEMGKTDAVNQVMNRYLALSSRALEATPKPDVLIWPETAYPTIFQKPRSILEDHLENQFNSFISGFPGTLAFGGYDSDEFGQEYNSLFVYHGPSKTKHVYHKSVLLMFGETLPFADDFPSVKAWFPTMGFFGRGPGAELKPLTNSAGQTFQIAPSICYEGLFTDHSVNGAIQGADALLNISNDSWFGPHGEPYLHLALTQFRSIETRLPLLRATNTGISVSIDPLGETKGRTEVMREQILASSIPHRLMPESPYIWIARRLGPNWYARFCQAILALILVALWFNSRREPSLHESTSSNATQLNQI